MRKIIFAAALLCMGLNLGVALDNSGEPDLEHGKWLFDRWCVHCHGVGMPASAALAVTYAGTDISPVIDEREGFFTPELVETFVRNGAYSMPFFRKIEINDKDMYDLGSYLSRDRSKDKK